MTQKTTTYLATAVRYFANPSLRGNAQETPEMEQRTIGVLSGLQVRLPLVVLRLDEQNHYDTQAVVVLEHGRQIAYLAADDAHQCVAEYGERLRVGIPVRVTEVNVEKHGVFWVEKPKMKGASSSAASSAAFSAVGASSAAAFSASLSLPAALDWSGWMEPAPLALPAAFRQRIESLELIIDFCLGEIEAGEEGGGPAMESQGTGAQRGSAGSSSPSGSSSFSSSEVTLCEYLGCWLEEVSFDVSREAHERVLRYRQLLEASGRPKLMEMAEKMDRALVKGGCIEVTRKRCEMWQQMMEDEGVKEDFDHLMAFSTSVPQVMLADTEMKVRQLPGRLYDFIADDAKFLSHLRYLMPPLCALRNILSYRLLRKLLCKKLGVSDAACRAAGNTDFTGSFSGCSSGSFSVSPSGSFVSPSGSSVSPSGSSVSSSGFSVSSSGSSVSVSENGEEKGAGSSVYLSPVRGKKIDFIRVVNVLYELGLFTDKDGVRCTKKEAFRAFGRAVNLDLSNYNKDLSRALNDTTTRERQLQIFKDMRQKMAEIYQDKN
ncbi:hypothetical protein [Segatella copri]|uniref:Uncharacterized protein n=1 Tax=Segatella copri TaxID=165179 RepID=A0AAW4N0L2_9BACT|nr:hypothetical protein [Segatella copri]MBV3386786.1 hypothetical protein [Segatella copri]MBV3394585.1 hypothetical protein [Segatella copri]MBV3404252.1 hypothetical protein [Segatella copri]